MSLDDTSDEELVRRFRSGETGSFDAIVHRFQDRIFRQASVCLYDNQQAADATQEVFLRSFKGLKGRPVIVKLAKNQVSEARSGRTFLS